MDTTRLHLTAPPHLKAPDTTERIMWSVVGSLVPIVAAALYFFGLQGLLVLVAAVVGALVTERWMGTPGSLSDGSAVITGLLLGLTLPPGIAVWIAFLGGVVAISLGKLIFGGLGQNVFNPALLGRAFLQAAFPTAITTWHVPTGSWTSVSPSTLALPLFKGAEADAVTGATPLGLMKFEAVSTDSWALMMGDVGGSLGETAGLLILVGGGYLALKNYLNWRIPVGIFITVAVFSQILFMVDPEQFATPVFNLFAGGLMLGAIYMATDMVTSPVTNKGCWIFAFGIGFLVVVIRTWGGLPEGVMYAILLMNAMVPFIDQATQPRVFGTGLADAPQEATS